MRLARDTSLAAHNVRVPCYKCGAMVNLSDVDADLDGPAFQAYYCNFGPGLYPDAKEGRCCIPGHNHEKESTQ